MNMKKPVKLIADREVAVMADWITGANEVDFHMTGVNWGRDLPEPALVADIRSIVEGDPSPDGQGTLSIARGIEVGHVFNLGKKYAEAMKATVLDAEGKAVVMTMGCYGIGVSRIVAAAIEQNSDENGIIWPEPMAPWRVAVCILNPKNAPSVVEAAEALYEKLRGMGIEACLDDRGLRPGPMLAGELGTIPIAKTGSPDATIPARSRARPSVTKAATPLLRIAPAARSPITAVPV